MYGHIYNMYGHIYCTYGHKYFISDHVYCIYGQVYCTSVRPRLGTIFCKHQGLGHARVVYGTCTDYSHVQSSYVTHQWLQCRTVS